MSCLAGAQASTQSVINQATALSNRVDYVSLNTHHADLVEGTQVPVAQVWPIDTGRFQGSTSATVWAADACASRVPSPFVPPSQETMTRADPCLYGDSASDQYEDVMRYFVQEAPVLTIVTTDQKEHIVQLCPLTSGVRYVFQTTDLGYRDVDVQMTGSGAALLVPAIQEVRVEKKREQLRFFFEDSLPR
jgi:hypothetical protein